jgi:hypothetical protein
MMRRSKDFPTTSILPFEWGVSLTRHLNCAEPMGGPSTEMGNHYRRMAEHCTILAEAEELGALVYGY